MKLFVTLFFGVVASPAHSVEELPVVNEFSIVGVISTGSTNESNIAVIKDHNSNKSLTIREGSILDKRFTVKAIHRKKIVVSDGSNEFQLAETPQRHREEGADGNIEAALNERYLNNYDTQVVEWGEGEFVDTEKMNSDSSSFSTSWKEYIKKYKEEIKNANTLNSEPSENLDDVEDNGDEIIEFTPDDDSEYGDQDTQRDDEDSQVEIYNY